jgi:hypothetical protein
MCRISTTEIPVFKDFLYFFNNSSNKFLAKKGPFFVLKDHLILSKFRLLARGLNNVVLHSTFNHQNVTRPSLNTAVWRSLVNDFVSEGPDLAIAICRLHVVITTSYE